MTHVMTQSQTKIGWMNAALGLVRGLVAATGKKGLQAKVHFDPREISDHLKRDIGLLEGRGSGVRRQ